MNWKLSLSATENARRELPKLMEKYFKAGRKAVKIERSPRELHRFRVKTKRLRYALEIFRPVYGTSIEPRLKGLQKLQHILGHISDHHAIRELLAQKQDLASDLDRALETKMEEFRNHWTTVFDRPGELERWIAYLTRRPPRQRRQARPVVNAKKA